jgi:hypothetical protein
VCNGVVASAFSSLRDGRNVIGATDEGRSRLEAAAAAIIEAWLM